MFDLAELLEFHASVHDSLNLGNFIDRLPAWMCSNTFVKGKPWSFEDHEFQLDILRESKPEVGVQKCSQVGITEEEVRRMLGFLAMSTGVTAIYTLPTRNFAMKFSKSRIDTVIDRSPYLIKLLKPGANGSEFKQIGSSSLYLGGAQNASQAISIPADYLVQDEIDFSNPGAVTAYESRIRHSDIKVRRQFSTPTISGYGISLVLDGSSQARYLCKCSKCGTESAIDFFRDVVVPGLDKEFDKFEKQDLRNDKYKVHEAYLACPKCRRSIDRDLADRNRRRWVHAYPSRSMAGYYIRPFDLMKYNPTHSVIDQIKGYARLQDYHNFVHGLTYKSDETEINLSTVTQNTTEQFQDFSEGCYMGVDVGKKLNVVILKQNGPRLDVIAIMTVDSSEDTAGELEMIYNRYGCYRMVIDSAPDWTLCKIVLSKMGTFAHPCVYVNENPRKPEMFTIKEDDNNILLASRTTVIDVVVSEVNKGRMHFPNCDEMGTFKKHLHGMKKTEEYDDTGQRQSKWTKISDEDHYFHALIYAYLASKIDEPDILEATSVAPTTVLGATMGGGGDTIETGMSLREALAYAGIVAGRRG